MPKHSKNYQGPYETNINQDYDRWNNIAKHLEACAMPRDVRTGEVYWVALGKNPGTEIDGKGKRFARPMVVLKPVSRHAFVGIPLTTRSHYENGYCQLQFGDQAEFATLMQIRITSTKRLYTRMGRLDRANIKKLRRALRDYLELATKEDTETTIFVHDATPVTSSDDSSDATANETEGASSGSASGVTISSAPRRSFSTEDFHAEFGGELEEDNIDWAEGHIDTAPSKPAKSTSGNPAPKSKKSPKKTSKAAKTSKKSTSKPTKSKKN